MKAEELVNLYDSFWFELQILKENPSPCNSSSSLSNPAHQIQLESQKLDLSDFPSSFTRSLSDELSSISSFKHDSFSPKSVLPKPKLHTEASDPSQKNQLKRKKKTRIRELQQGQKSKSLSELEFEEIKGFMDLGFVFSEEDKYSNLALIIPGLQRLGMNEEEKEGFDNNSAIPRPYLSEAWEALDQKKKKDLLRNWRISSLSNEVSMKDSLKCWAHAVASAVR